MERQNWIAGDVGVDKWEDELLSDVHVVRVMRIMAELTEEGGQVAVPRAGENGTWSSMLEWREQREWC